MTRVFKPYRGLSWRRIQLTILAALFLPAQISHANEVAADEAIPKLMWHAAATPDGNGSRWYRFTFNQNINGRTGILTFAAEGTVTVHVNGQRLIRQASLQPVDGKVSAVAFDVSRVLRDGRNCVAIELRTEQNLSLLAASLTLSANDSDTANIAGEWRISETAPPIGWQQTDFNARDWPAVTGSAERPEGSFEISATEEVAQAFVSTGQARTPFKLLDGDHVVMLGATFLERAQQYGHLETALTAADCDINVTFRNLGWDADTVFAESRGIFDPPAVGYLRMIEHVRAEEPTVIIVNYGQNEALATHPEAQAFRTQLNQLLNDLSTTGATIVLMTPHELLPAIRPIPDSSRFNSRIRDFVQIVESVAAERSLNCFNLFDDFTRELNSVDRRLGLDEQTAGVAASLSLDPDLQALAASRWSDNGMHLNDRGYQAASLIVRNRVLGIPSGGTRIVIDSTSEKLMADGAEIRDVKWNGEPRTLVTFQLKEPQVSSIPTQISIADGDSGMGWAGRIWSTDAADKESNAVNSRGNLIWLPVSSKYEALRVAVMRKNELYFHRWRPQNITYLFGFRKHEQGNNAVEIAQFDPFVKELEEQIQSLKQPEWRTVVITRH